MPTFDCNVYTVQGHQSTGCNLSTLPPEENPVTAPNCNDCTVKGDLSAGCEDEDECELDVYHCDPFAECANTNGSYDCVCREGFTGDGFNCQVSRVRDLL